MSARQLLRGWLPCLCAAAIVCQVAFVALVLSAVSAVTTRGGAASADAAETPPVVVLAAVKPVAAAELQVAQAKPAPTPLDEYDAAGLRTLARRAKEAVADAYTSAKEVRPTADGVSTDGLLAAVRVRPEVLVARVNWSAVGNPFRSAADIGGRAKAATADSLGATFQVDRAEFSAAVVRQREAADRVARERTAAWLARSLAQLVENKVTITLHGPGSPELVRPNAEIVTPMAAEAVDKATSKNWQDALAAIWDDKNADDNVKAARTEFKKLGLTYATTDVTFDPVAVAISWKLKVPTEQANDTTKTQVGALLLDGPVSAVMEKWGWDPSDRTKIKTAAGFQVTLEPKDKPMKEDPIPVVVSGVPCPPLVSGVPCPPLVSMPVTVGGCGFAPVATVGCGASVAAECGGGSTVVVGFGAPSACGCGSRSGGLFGFGLLTRPLFNRCR